MEHATRGQKVRGAVTHPPTRLGTPVALLMLGGLFLVYYALQGWDKKYGTFNGRFAGKGAIPGGTASGTETPSPLVPQAPKKLADPTKGIA